MLGVAWETYPGRSSQVVVPEGTSFSGLRTIRGVRVSFSGTTPAITDLGAVGAPAGPLVLEDGGTITSSGSGPLVRVSHSASVRIGEGSAVLQGGGPVIDVAGTNSLNVFVDGAFGALRGNTVSGPNPGSFLLLQVADSAAGDPSGALSLAQPAFLGTIEPLNDTRSRSYPTPVAAGPTPLSSASLTVPFDPSSGPVLIFLPPASTCRGEDVTAKNVTVSAANDGILVAFSGDNVDDAPNVHVSGARASVTVRSNGDHQWMVVARA